MAFSKAEEIFKIVESNSANLLSKSKWLFILVIVLILITGLSAYYTFLSLSTLEKTEQQRYEMLQLSSQVRLSSDNLTLMARAYAATGKTKYLTFFNQILAIRNGEHPRPKHYGRVYWDFLMPEHGLAPSENGKAISLKTMLKNAGITESERQMLNEAQAASDKLVEIEQKAFSLVDIGLTQAPNYNQSEQRLSALDLLYSETYLQAKAHIMAKVNTFLQLQGQRTEAAMRDAGKVNKVATLFVLLSFVMLFVAVIAYAYFRQLYSRRLINLLKESVDGQFDLLTQKNEILAENAKVMKDTFEQLVEAEKMASLGSLVSGVAHEVNTPLGIAVTAGDYIANEARTLETQFGNETLSRDDITRYFSNMSESVRLLTTSLQRAAELIQSFKQVAVDQSHQDIRSINLKSYLDDVFVSLTPLFKNKGITIRNLIRDDLLLQVEVGSIGQIFTNLVNNSIIHGFEQGNREGEIAISATDNEQQVVISFRDNGVGMSESVLSKVFEPFYTTNRSNGGSGLGMSIVYNLVTAKLHGSIECTSEVNAFTEITITLPKALTTTNPNN